jgi:uncharacterized membrane protein
MEPFGRFWKILHGGASEIRLSDGYVGMVLYPLVPWIGVMSAGYCLGRAFDLDSVKRQRLLLRLGMGMTAAFVLLRFANGYGDPAPWSMQSNWELTTLSFLRVSKYPPSLMYLLVTLGPALMALALVERPTFGARHPLLVFGRVPFFYYLAHWYLLHLVAVVLAEVRYGRADFMLALPPSISPIQTAFPPDYGYHLWFVYLVWGAMVAALYPASRWFAGVKARNRSRWLSYL